ncbi:4-hydroxybenzoate 3-monooxygenase [Streptomyces clavuligerus]|uniref:4-hydroxybenzoate 3-monooxygenase n=1 Tax=Streptomyces clavuligerus TaxID=1901 RepID=B5GTK4_STRCL|nr:4-hydroxybenzoate 3-monooxygenase [Streptomyces clavuligerus]EDY49650.1 4-hydroxybenzoate 3-monooxygenase [Streptomyces clavuligerus]EFG04073.1 4-hydroxybenzoate 3-monooxygenase [Streptomyces clavuligerus]MBY6307438.1 4-hydroxybenzoate 3-monooxygenase [Streptomyces clavuligerus]QCS10001.1 4-hydroxybenzoate 3-monooxygenase [Streptomyces clavuligerus]QPJ97955.1 4-hydroxybenzoate 3-monooxygenase [Streptomyces clavuligerus]
MIILGAGPAGLVVGNLLRAAGIDCVILERATRAQIQTRARAGFLAPHTVRVLDRHGLADGLHRTGTEHTTCEFRTESGRFRLDYGHLGKGEPHTVYPQQQLVTDLLARYLEAGGRIHFATPALAVLDTDGPRPSVTVQGPDGRPDRWQGTYVAGCDGRHGAARRSLPHGTVRRYHHDHGITWLGLLAAAPPSLDAIGYAVHPEGFAGHMARTPEVTRYYLQWARGTPAEAWSDDRIWTELSLRMRAAAYGPLHHGPLLQRTVIDLESDILEPLRHGTLLLAGDAASLLAPAAAKGANLAVLEAELLGRGLIDAIVHGRPDGLDAYSARCLSHIWRAQRFSQWMIHLLHDVSEVRDGPGAPAPYGGPLRQDTGSRRACLTTLRTSRAEQDWFAENYVGI